MKTPISASDQAYLVLTAQRFFYMLELWQHATGEPPSDVVRALDRLIEARVGNEPKIDGWPVAILAKLKAGFDGAREVEPRTERDVESGAAPGNEPG